MPDEKNNDFLKAVRLYNTADGMCTFQLGRIPANTRIEVSYFFGQTKIDNYEKSPHPAPRTQYVVTLKGKLKFTVSNGDTFIIEPGTILIAEDVEGPGHSWEIVEGTQWERLYIPYTMNTSSRFIPDSHSILDRHK